MPLQNRVTPFGTLIVTPARGEWMGNRGVLHDSAKTITKHSDGNRWIYCRLAFRNQHRKVMTPGRYTELFFLDEATALAAGHRPCIDCQKPKFRFFRDSWSALFATTPGQKISGTEIDVVLQGERLAGTDTKVTFSAKLSELPFGTMITGTDPTVAYLISTDGVRAWLPDGYGAPETWPADQEVVVLTPASLVKLYQAGFRPKVHPSGLPPVEAGAETSPAVADEPDAE
jgi:hypothetical protein